MDLISFMRMHEMHAPTPTTCARPVLVRSLTGPGLGADVRTSDLRTQRPTSRPIRGRDATLH